MQPVGVQLRLHLRPVGAQTNVQRTSEGHTPPALGQQAQQATSAGLVRVILGGVTHASRILVPACPAWTATLRHMTRTAARKLAAYMRTQGYRVRVRRRVVGRQHYWVVVRL